MHALADPVDGIVVREAARAWAGGPVAVLEDQSGALTTDLIEQVGVEAVRVWCDSLREERAVAQAIGGVDRAQLLPALGPELLSDVRLVSMRLPKSLAALDEMAEAVARWAHPSVELLAGGRVKHMNRSMNEVLARHFSSVRASLGTQKSRVLVASGPRTLGEPRYPLSKVDPDLDLTVCAHGGAFAGATVDAGSRFLLSCADSFPSVAQHVVDLGCGTGVLAVSAARRLPGATVLALDESRAAVLSATATVRANGVADRVEVRRADLMEGVADRSVDLILSNPPFHHGTTRDSAVAFEMFAEAARTLSPGGELWLVYNSHLPYLRALRRLVGSTSIVAQNPRFTVARSVRSPA